MLFIAGQVAVDRDGALIGKNDIEKQAVQVFENLRAVLQAAGGSLENLVMTTTYLTDIAHREAFSRVRAEYFKEHPPTSTLLVVKGLANADYLLEIDGIAVI